MSCPRDTDGDGDCGNRNCPDCGGGPTKADKTCWICKQGIEGGEPIAFYPGRRKGWAHVNCSSGDQKEENS